MISLNEVGVPMEIAKELTVPIKINKNNKESMKKIIKNGPSTHPGANYVIRPDGVRKKVTDENKNDIAEEIDIGYIVERHMIDGDITVMNRQPSLHRMSVMAHKARIMPYRTLRINLTVTIPYNADFDGDEMNLHLPQTEEAQAETEMLLSVQNNIRSPRYGLPIIACKHDHITGSFLLTKKDTKLSLKEASRLLFAIGMEDFDIKDTYTGKEIFSTMLPKDLNIEFKSQICMRCKKCEAENCPHDAYVVIKNGVLRKGVIDDSALGEKKGKLIDIFERKYGPDATKNFLDNISRISLEWITSKGFSIAISDTDLSEKAMKKIEMHIEDYEKNVAEMVKAYKAGRLEKIPGLTPEQTLETRILQLGGVLSNHCNDTIKNDLPFNSAVTMARSGARGSFVNLMQMCGLVGQEAIGGERIKRGYVDRTLSHFEERDRGLKACGFVRNGYKKGLNPVEFFFDAMNSRENLMDKSLHTRHSGYMERRLVNALYDLRVEHDGTVRDSKNHVVQFLAGGDGIDPAKSDNGSIKFDRILGG
jgi:DNA-directed RNA polymerase subunit A'